MDGRGLLVEVSGGGRRWRSWERGVVKGRSDDEEDGFGLLMDGGGDRDVYGGCGWIWEMSGGERVRVS